MGGRLCGVDSMDFDAKAANGLPMHYNRHLWLIHIASKVRLVFPIVVGIAAIFVTVLLHASVTVLVVSRFMARITCGMAANSLRRGAFLAAATTVLALKHYADIVLWAVGFDRSASSREAIWLDGLRRFVDALPAPPQRFLYVSSTSVYGDQEGDAITESTAPAPATEGGRCCWQAETLLRERLAPHPQTHVTVLRMAGIYGPDRLLRRVDDLRNQQPLPGSAEQWLNLIHVDDGVRAIDWAATTADPPSLVNVVNAGTLTRHAYYALLAELADAPPPVFGGPASGRPRGGNKRVASEWAGQIPFAFDAVAAGLRDAWSRSAVQ